MVPLFLAKLLYSQFIRDLKILFLNIPPHLEIGKNNCVYVTKPLFNIAVRPHTERNKVSFVDKISAYNRKRKWSIFLREIVPTPAICVLDVGFSEKEYSSVDNYIEKHYPYPEMLTALGIHIPVKFKTRYPAVTAVNYDGELFPFENNTFEVVWSNAVIEHVGGRNKQLRFIKEIRRVSKRAFVTTPNRFFPVEVHTRTPLLHYLPKRTFDKYLTLTGKEWATGEYMHLLSRTDIETLLIDAGIEEYKIIHNRLGWFTMDFVILF